MGSKMRAKANKETKKLEIQYGFVNQFMSYINDALSNKNKKKLAKQHSAAMDGLLSITIDLIERRLPISDDILLLCFRYELECNKENKTFQPTQTKLWQAIEKVLNKILKIPNFNDILDVTESKKDFLWFKMYLFNSSVKYIYIYIMYYY